MQRRGWITWFVTAMGVMALALGLGMALGLALGVPLLRAEPWRGVEPPAPRHATTGLLHTEREAGLVGVAGAGVE